MNPQSTEQRGWPVQAAVHTHHNDDPFVDIAEDDIESWWRFWAWLMLSAILLGGYAIYSMWGPW